MWYKKNIRNKRISIVKDRNYLAPEEFTRVTSGHRGRQTLNARIAYYSRPAANGCVEWTARLIGNAMLYPAIVCLGTRWQVSRLVWIRAHGRIPEGNVIRHVCDNSLCIAEAHLEVGTVAQNVADRVRRGRSSRGADHWYSQITEADVLAIRASSETSKVLSNRHGLSMGAISHIRDRYTWKHLPAQPEELIANQKRRRLCRLTEETAQFIIDNPDMRLKDLADQIGVPKPTVWAVRWRKAWKHLVPSVQAAD